MVLISAGGSGSREIAVPESMATERMSAPEASPLERFSFFSRTMFRAVSLIMSEASGTLKLASAFSKA